MAIAALIGGSMEAKAQTPRTLIVGTWEVVSRVDRDSAGHISIEPILGREPRGYLIYDAAGHVAAQLMSVQRTASACDVRGPTDSNNSTYVCAYDAYFGRYEVDASAGTVIHVLDGALSPSDVGRRLTRRFQVAGDTLTIQFEVRGLRGQPLTRTMTWHRVST
jgi:catechol 1,2-dioxygenase